MEFEDILQDVGGFGRFQKTMLAFFLLPVSCLVSWFFMGVVFMTSTPDHWCHVSELSSNLTIDQQRIISSAPTDPSCTMYNITDWSRLGSGNYSVPLEAEQVSCIDGWQYDKTDWDATVSTKWDLVCENGHYSSMVISLQTVGGLLGTSFYGALCDRIGRKKVIILISFVVLATEISSMLVNNFKVFAVMRLINGTIFPTLFSLPCILMMELVSPEYRATVSGLYNCMWSLGLCLLPVVAYLARSWIALSCINCFTSVLLLIEMKFVPESPSWLIGRGRYEEARDIMVDIATKNNKSKSTTDLLAKINILGEKKKRQENQGTSHIMMFKYSRLRRNFFILSFCWTANATAYLGLTYNIRNLVGSEFMNFFLMSLVEGPGCVVFWVAMAKLGRRWTATFGFLLTGIVCMIPLIDLPYTEIIATVLGKFVIAGNFMVTDQQGSELYPTVSRSFGMGLSFTLYKLATFMVPYLAYLSVYSKLIPYMVIAVTCFIATVLASFLPETVNENLPQTVPDADELGKNKKYFSWERGKPKAKMRTPSEVPSVNLHM